MRRFRDVEHLRGAVGTHLGHSAWHEVTQRHIDLFAEATGDHQWIHVDRERAARGPFGTTLAHGFLTVALVPMMVWEVYDIDQLSMGLNYGTDKVRFPTPVPSGSRVRGGVELLSVEPGSGGVRVVDRVTVELAGAAKPACVAETVRVLIP